MSQRRLLLDNVPNPAQLDQLSHSLVAVFQRNSQVLQRVEHSRKVAARVVVG
jgi:hypothetical protein